MSQCQMTVALIWQWQECLGLDVAIYMTCCCCYNALEGLEYIPEIFLRLQQCLMQLDISKNNLEHRSTLIFRLGMAGKYRFILTFDPQSGSTANA